MGEVKYFLPQRPSAIIHYSSRAWQHGCQGRLPTVNITNHCYFYWLLLFSHCNLWCSHCELLLLLLLLNFHRNLNWLFKLSLHLVNCVQGIVEVLCQLILIGDWCILC
jgi:hypothetical protein